MFKDNLNISGVDHIVIVDDQTGQVLLNKRGEQPRKDVVKDKK